MSTTEGQSPVAPEGVHEQEQSRRANRDAIAALGLDPYSGRVDGLLPLNEAYSRYDQAADEDHKANSKNEGFVDRRAVVQVAGRVMLYRDTGKLIFMNLRDDTGDLQIAVSKRDCAEPGFEVAKLVDLGDVVVAGGPLVKTRTGEVTIWASSLAMGAKSLTPPPEKHAGLSNIEARYRQRYVDLWSNPATMRVFKLRAQMVSTLRAELESRGFVEVETPMLQVQAGGAAARPFITHMNALDIDLYMRIAPELYLKRLLVGGLPRVFEINRNFRNEGLDKQHNPEFTMLEIYQAFGDFETVMALTEALVRAAAGAIAAARADDDGVDAGAVRVPFLDYTIDFGSPFQRVRYSDLFERTLGFPMSDTDRVWETAAAKGLLGKYAAHLAEEGREVDATTLRGTVADVIIVNELFEHAAEPTLDPAKPTFITHYPAALSPLTRPSREDPSLAERADLFIGGMEIGPHYTELNDPDVQADKFRAQLAGIDDEESTFRSFDADFVDALKVGMPPAGGLGLGVDRLAMLLTSQPTIRDVVLFPLLRPEQRTEVL